MLLRPRSTSLITTPDGRIAERRTYWPFGANRSEQIVGAPRTDLLYTGQREEKDDAAELGLYNYKARFYSTALGRFLSVDPLVGSGGDPQSWNSYTYVRNNPIRHVDPTGQRYKYSDETAATAPAPVDPYVSDAAAQAWVSAPAMQPYEPCTACIEWQAAAAAYQDAAAAQAWVSQVPQYCQACANLLALASASSRFPSMLDAAVTWQDIASHGPGASAYACQVVTCGGEAKEVSSIGVNVSVCAFVCGSIEIGVVVPGQDNPSIYVSGGKGISTGVSAGAQVEVAEGFSRNGITGFQGSSDTRGVCTWRACGGTSQNDTYDAATGSFGFNVGFPPVTFYEGDTHTYTFP